MGERIVIAGMGAATAVGRGAWESAAPVRAGISGFTQHPYMIDTAGEPMRVALAPWLDIGVQGVERFEALLLPAIEEALTGLSLPKTAPHRWAVALAPVSYTHLRAHETVLDLVCRLLLEKKTSSHRDGQNQHTHTRE